MAGPLFPPDPRAGIKYSLFRYRGLRDYGLETGSYTIRVYMRGYIQALAPAFELRDLDQPTIVSVTISTGVSEVSLHMFRGGGINITAYSIDWQRPPIPRAWVWDNTSVAILVYDIASRAFIDVVYFWNATKNQWSLPRANSRFDTLPWPTWKTVYGLGSSFLKTNGSTIVDRFGPDIPAFVSPFPNQDMATTLFLQSMIRIGLLYNPQLYRTVNFRSTLAIYPGAYAINGWTYGYVQEGIVRLGDLGNTIVAVGQIGTQGDIRLRLIKGLNFTLTIVFKREGVFTQVPFNASMRIRIYDESDTLVAAASTSFEIGTLLPGSDAGIFANGVRVSNAGAATPPISAGTRAVEIRHLAGLFGYTDLSGGTSAVQRATLFSPDHGVWGRTTQAGAYFGRWLVTIDMVNWYLPNRFYPPVPALLQGESPSLFSYNHLGPFALRRAIEIPNNQIGSDISVAFELDQRGYVQGTVQGLTWSDEFRTMSWAAIEMRGGTRTYLTYTWDGFYDAYLDAGEYSFTVYEWTKAGEGHMPATVSVRVSDGQFQQGLNFYLLRSEVPIPEFRPLLPVILAGVGSIWVLRRRKRATTPVVSRGKFFRMSGS